MDGPDAPLVGFEHKAAVTRLQQCAAARHAAARDSDAFYAALDKVAAADAAEAAAAARDMSAEAQAAAEAEAARSNAARHAEEARAMWCTYEFLALMGFPLKVSLKAAVTTKRNFHRERLQSGRRGASDDLETIVDDALNCAMLIIANQSSTAVCARGERGRAPPLV